MDCGAYDSLSRRACTCMCRQAACRYAKQKRFHFFFFISFSLILLLYYFLHPLPSLFTGISNVPVDNFSFHFLCYLFFISSNIFLHYSLFSFFCGLSLWIMDAADIVILNISFLMFFVVCALLPVCYFSFHSCFLFPYLVS